MVTVCAARANGLLNLGRRAEVEHEAGVARHRVPDLRRAGCDRLPHASDGGQRRPVGIERLGGVLGLFERVGHDGGDRVAHKGSAVGERAVGRLEIRGAVGRLPPHAGSEAPVRATSGSFAVRIRRTPGHAAAARVSMPRSSAAACGERTT
jgi:hypothetical protein